MIAVRYVSRGGNTKKLAEAVAAAVGEAALTLDQPLEEKVDILFLGSSLYAFTFDEAVGTFLESHADKIGKLVCFGSSASGQSTYPKIKEFALQKGIEVSEEHFNCLGHFLFMHKQRPNDKDLAAVASFAKKFI